jgi:pimeloyl-ACP methyl ester carboxylesterase
MRNIFIHGIEGCLGSHFAAQCFSASDDRVFYFSDPVNGIATEQVPALVARVAPQQSEKSLQEMVSRLQSADAHSSVDAAELWYFVNVEVPESSSETLDRLFAICARIGIAKFNFVCCDDVDQDSAAQALYQDVAQRCKARNITYRAFSTSLVLGREHAALKQRSVLSRFLVTLHSLKAEIEERSPQYFDYQALRFVTQANAGVNLLPADVAAELLLNISREESTTNSHFRIANPQKTPLAALFEYISIAYGISLLPAENAKSLNAIDQIFQERLSSPGDILKQGTSGAAESETYRIAGISPDRALFEEEACITLLESLRKDEDKALASRRRRARELPDKLERKTVDRDGSELTYYVAGTTGVPIVVLNALGQGLEYWYRLLDNLMEDHRVIIWEPRGVVAPPPPFELAQQIDDLTAVLQHENLQACHLVGWCTGGKVAVEFHLRHPSVVRSMVFLNNTLKCDGGPKELDSPYERNMETLCRMLVRKPAMAASVMNTLNSRDEENETEMLENGGEQLSIDVLSLMNADLKPYVLAPFRTQETTVNYAHQLVDFWKYDVRSRLAQVTVPVLLISAEYDQVATPAASFEAAALFPNARHIHVKGATHYCLYDRPEFVADMLKEFFRNADGLISQPRAPESISDCIEAESADMGVSCSAVATS